MNLSILQLKKIDNYLKSKGVEFWDVRFEFADHIACFIEEKLANNFSFEVAFKAMEEDFTRSYLKQQQKHIRKKINKQILKSYLKEIKETLIKPLYMLSLLVFGGGLKYVMENYAIKYGLEISFFVMIFLLVMILVKSISNFKMHKGSRLLSLSGTYVIFFTLIFQVIGYVKEQMLTSELLQMVLISSIIIICFLMITWFNCYSKLVKKQKKYYDLINS